MNDFISIFALDVSSTEKSSQNDWLNKGKELLELEEYVKAYECFSNELKINTRNLEALLYVSMVLFKLDRHDEALSYINKALELDPLKAKMWTFKGLVLPELNRCEEAIKCFQKSLELDPVDIFPMISCARLLFHLDRYEEAISYYDKALEIDPKNEDAWYEKGRSMSYLLVLKENTQNNSSKEHSFSSINKGNYSAY